MSKQTKCVGGCVLALASVVGLVASAQPASAAEPDRSSVYMVVMGATRSDTAERKVMLRALRDVVLPAAIEDNAMVYVGVVNGTSTTRPHVIARADFDVADEAGDNPVLEEELTSERIDKLSKRVKRRLAQFEPSLRSDPFGAARWASTVFAQYPAATSKRLAMLNDAVATMPGCNLTARDLSAANRAQVLDDCTYGRLPALDGVAVIQGGAGLLLDESMPPETALAIEDLWRSFWKGSGAELRCYAALLVADCSVIGH